MANTAIPKEERRPNQASAPQNQSAGQGKSQAPAGGTLRRQDNGGQMTQKNQPGQMPGQSTMNYLSPPVHIYETKDGYMLEAEMPGVNRTGLEVLLEGNELTIVGHRDGTLPAGSGSVLYRESRSASFRRVFELDPAIDAQRITARVENGVLYLTLPKAESVKPRKINVS